MDPASFVLDDKVRQLQLRLWAAAKRSSGRRFHALYDHVGRSDVLLEAWERVRRNGGAAGVDGVTLAEVERVGVDAFLEGIRASLVRGVTSRQLDSVFLVSLPQV
jgi:RNA-directed DNA polymerase